VRGGGGKPIISPRRLEKGGERNYGFYKELLTRRKKRAKVPLSRSWGKKHHGADIQEEFAVHKKAKKTKKASVFWGG